MSKRDNGGYAFPFQIPETETSHAYAWEGMTLRDYFAAQAPIDYQMAIGVYGKDCSPPFSDKQRAAFLAVWTFLRYEYADAMLDARKR